MGLCSKIGRLRPHFFTRYPILNYSVVPESIWKYLSYPILFFPFDIFRLIWGFSPVNLDSHVLFIFGD